MGDILSDALENPDFEDDPGSLDGGSQDGPYVPQNFPDAAWNTAWHFATRIPENLSSMAQIPMAIGQSFYNDISSADPGLLRDLEGFAGAGLPGLIGRHVGRKGAENPKKAYEIGAPMVAGAAGTALAGPLGGILASAATSGGLDFALEKLPLSEVVGNFLGDLIPGMGVAQPRKTAKTGRGTAPMKDVANVQKVSDRLTGSAKANLEGPQGLGGTLQEWILGAFGKDKNLAGKDATQSIKNANRLAKDPEAGLGSLIGEPAQTHLGTGAQIAKELADRGPAIKKFGLLEENMPLGDKLIELDARGTKVMKTLDGVVDKVTDFAASGKMDIGKVAVAEVEKIGKDLRTKGSTPVNRAGAPETVQAYNDVADLIEGGLIPRSTARGDIPVDGEVINYTSRDYPQIGTASGPKAKLPELKAMDAQAIKDYGTALDMVRQLEESGAAPGSLDLSLAKRALLQTYLTHQQLIDKISGQPSAVAKAIKKRAVYDPGTMGKQIEGGEFGSAEGQVAPGDSRPQQTYVQISDLLELRRIINDRLKELGTYDKSRLAGQQLDPSKGHENAGNIKAWGDAKEAVDKLLISKMDGVIKQLSPEQRGELNADLKAAGISSKVSGSVLKDIHEEYGAIKSTELALQVAKDNMASSLRTRVPQMAKETSAGETGGPLRVTAGAYGEPRAGLNILRPNVPARRLAEQTAALDYGDELVSGMNSMLNLQQNPAAMPMAPTQGLDAIMGAQMAAPGMPGALGNPIGSLLANQPDPAALTTIKDPYNAQEVASFLPPEEMELYALPLFQAAMMGDETKYRQTLGALAGALPQIREALGPTKTGYPSEVDGVVTNPMEQIELKRKAEMAVKTSQISSVEGYRITQALNSNQKIKSVPSALRPKDPLEKFLLQ